jgi:hypothetical protein
VQKLNICLCPPIFGLDKFLDCHDKGSFVLEGKYSESNASTFSEISENRIFPFNVSDLNDDDILRESISSADACIILYKYELDGQPEKVLDSCVQTGKLYLLVDIEKFKVNDFVRHISDFLKKNSLQKIFFSAKHTDNLILNSCIDIFSRINISSTRKKDRNKSFAFSKKQKPNGFKVKKKPRRFNKTKQPKWKSNNKTANESFSTNNQD